MCLLEKHAHTHKFQCMKNPKTKSFQSRGQKDSPFRCRGCVRHGPQIYWSMDGRAASTLISALVLQELTVKFGKKDRRKQDTPMKAEDIHEEFAENAEFVNDESNQPCDSFEHQEDSDILNNLDFDSDSDYNPKSERSTRLRYFSYNLGTNFGVFVLTVNCRVLVQAKKKKKKSSRAQF